VAKTRHKKMALIKAVLKDGGMDRWYLADKAVEYTDSEGRRCVKPHGRMIDVHDSIQPYLNGNNLIMTRYEHAIHILLKENLELKGLTVTEREMNMRWKELCEEVKIELPAK